MNKSRKILVINDDGILADGLKRLAKAAVKLGEVWIVAPDGQRSAASQSITLHDEIMVCPVNYPVENVKAFSCSGTPADCARIGILGLMPERPDIVLSGINDGYNTGTDLQYSATAGAAFEASFQGCPAVALSEGRTGHEVTNRYLEEILSEVMDYRGGEGEILNVNFCSCPLEKYRGILRNRKVSKSSFFVDRYHMLEELPGGAMRFIAKGLYREAAEEGSDLRAVLDGYISIGTVRNVE